jgi:glycosyltransferase EpsH
MGRNVRRIDISVIIPVYNVERWLAQCLDSMTAQTVPDMEIICVDDGSTDKSGRICDTYSERDERFRVIHKPNGGVSAARNDGIKAASGEWIMFVDSDDWLDPDTCEVALRAALDHSADVVLWAYTREFDNGRNSPRRLAAGDRAFSGEAMRALHRRVVGPVGDELRDPGQLHSWGTVWGKLYRREVITDTRFVDTRTVGSAEDALFNVEVLGRAARAFYIDRPMYHHRKFDASTTARHNPRLTEGWNRLHDLMMQTTSHLGDDFARALDNRVALGLIGHGLNELYSPRERTEKIATIRRIISTDRYRTAIGRLELRRLPLHWRLFFAAARGGHAAVVLLLLRVIERMR